MAFTPKDNSGALFQNDKKGVESRPDYRGDAMYNGELIEISGWKKEGKNGTFLSLSLKPKGSTPVREERKPEPKTPDPFDDVPFN